MNAIKNQDQFDELVLSAIEDLPDLFLDCLENVAVVVEEWPDRATLESVGLRRRSSLLGLYQGIPQPDRTHGYNLVLPDKISIYQGPIESICRTDDEVREQVRTTVLHEIGHYFGIDDDRLHELGMG